jgi:HEAT repeat protein
MDFQEFSERSKTLPPRKKIEFIHNNIQNLSEEEKISFLLSIIKEKKSSPAVRATALKFLRQTSYQDFKTYQEFLKNCYQPVARASKKALKDLKAQKEKNKYVSQSVLSKIESVKEKKKRLRIIKVIARIDAPWVPEVLLSALEIHCEEIQDFIINELGYRKDLNLDIFRQKLKASPWYVKSAILKIMGTQKNPLAIKHIKVVFKEHNVEVLRSAAQALGEIGGKEALALLVQLAKDKNHFVKISAEEALRKASKLKFC